MINYFVSFFDKKGLDIFEISYESFKRHNFNYEYYVGVSIDIFDEVKRKFSNDDKIKVFNVSEKLTNYSEPGFSSITNMTYARFHINEIFPIFSKFDENFVYLDIDIIHSKKFILLDEWKDKNIVFGDGLNIDENIDVTSGISYKFWQWFYENKRKSIDVELKDDFDLVVKRNLEMHRNFENFNAGVMIINNPKNFFTACSKVLNSKLWVVLDDQTLLNYFSDGLFERSNLSKIYNFMLNVNKELSNETIVYHFAGNNKELMLDYKKTNDDIYTYLEKNKTNDKWK